MNNAINEYLKNGFNINSFRSIDILNDISDFYREKYIIERKFSEIHKNNINNYKLFFDLIEQYKLNKALDVKNKINVIIKDIFSAFKYCVGDSFNYDDRKNFHNSCDKNKVTITFKNVIDNNLYLNIRIGNKYVDSMFDYKKCRIYSQLLDDIKYENKTRKEIEFLSKFIEIFKEEKLKVYEISDINVKRLYRMYNVSNLIKCIVNSLPGIISYKIIYEANESKNKYEIRREQYRKEHRKIEMLQKLNYIKENIETLDEEYISAFSFHLHHFDHFMNYSKLFNKKNNE